MKLNDEVVEALRERWGIAEIVPKSEGANQDEPKPFVVKPGFPGCIEFEHRHNFASDDTYHFWVKFPGGSHEHILRTWNRQFAEREIARYLAMGIKVEKWKPY